MKTGRAVRYSRIGLQEGHTAHLRNYLLKAVVVSLGMNEDKAGMKRPGKRGTCCSHYFIVGYQMGTRLSIHRRGENIGVRLTWKVPVG
jgi:hypothetical protein